MLAYEQSQFERARMLYDQALALYRELDDKRGLAMTLLNLGIVDSLQGEYERARAFHEEALGTTREIADTLHVGISLGRLGEDARVRGDYEGARALSTWRASLRRLGGALYFGPTEAAGLGDYRFYSRAIGTHPGLPPLLFVSFRDGLKGRTPSFRRAVRWMYCDCRAGALTLL